MRNNHVASEEIRMKGVPLKEWNPLHEGACSEITAATKIKLWRKINVFLTQKQLLLPN